ncbi:MAG: hypothetical protein NW204_13540 [Xanthomonadaceae bacterium]|nr:hypothetical protein [Xanthomonadaceae bacterium]
MDLQIGDRVRVRAPFDMAFPYVYTIDGVNPETGAFQICGDRDFDAAHLEKVEE